MANAGDSLWLVGCLSIALAAVTSKPAARERRESQSMFFPALFGVIAVGVLAWDHYERVNEIIGRDPEDPSTQYVLIQLVDAGYLTRTALGDRHGSGPPGPRTVRLAEKGLQRVANWPSSDSPRASK